MGSSPAVETTVHETLVSTPAPTPSSLLHTENQQLSAFKGAKEAFYGCNNGSAKH